MAIQRDQQQIGVATGRAPGLANAPSVSFTVGGAGAAAGRSVMAVGAELIDIGIDQMRTENIRAVENDAWAAPLIIDPTTGARIRPATPPGGWAIQARWDDIIDARMVDQTRVDLEARFDTIAAEEWDDPAGMRSRMEAAAAGTLAGVDPSTAGRAGVQIQSQIDQRVAGAQFRQAQADAANAEKEWIVRRDEAAEAIFNAAVINDDAELQASIATFGAYTQEGVSLKWIDPAELDRAGTRVQELVTMADLYKRAGAGMATGTVDQTALSNMITMLEGPGGEGISAFGYDQASLWRAIPSQKDREFLAGKMRTLRTEVTAQTSQTAKELDFLSLDQFYAGGHRGRSPQVSEARTDEYLRAIYETLPGSPADRINAIMARTGTAPRDQIRSILADASAKSGDDFSDAYDVFLSLRGARNADGTIAYNEYNALDPGIRDYWERVFYEARTDNDLGAARARVDDAIRDFPNTDLRLVQYAKDPNPEMSARATLRDAIQRDGTFKAYGPAIRSQIEDQVYSNLRQTLWANPGLSYEQAIELEFERVKGSWTEDPYVEGGYTPEDYAVPRVLDGANIAAYGQTTNAWVEKYQDVIRDMMGDGNAQLGISAEDVTLGENAFLEPLRGSRPGEYFVKVYPDGNRNGTARILLNENGNPIILDLDRASEYERKVQNDIAVEIARAIARGEAPAPVFGQRQDWARALELTLREAMDAEPNRAVIDPDFQLIPTESALRPPPPPPPIQTPTEAVTTTRALTPPTVTPPREPPADMDRFAQAFPDQPPRPPASAPYVPLKGSPVDAAIIVMEPNEITRRIEETLAEMQGIQQLTGVENLGLGPPPTGEVTILDVVPQKGPVEAPDPGPAPVVVNPQPTPEVERRDLPPLEGEPQPYTGEQPEATEATPPETTRSITAYEGSQADEMLASIARKKAELFEPRVSPDTLTEGDRAIDTGGMETQAFSSNRHNDPLMRAMPKGVLLGRVPWSDLPDWVKEQLAREGKRRDEYEAFRKVQQLRYPERSRANEAFDAVVPPTTRSVDPPEMPNPDLGAARDPFNQTPPAELIRYNPAPAPAQPDADGLLRYAPEPPVHPLEVSPGQAAIEDQLSSAREVQLIYRGQRVDKVPAVVPRTIAIAQAATRHIGKDRVIINSGYDQRPGRPGSQHPRKTAIDQSIRGWTQAEVIAYIEEASRLGAGGIGIYGTFIHIDTRPSRAAWGPDGHNSSIPAWARPALDKHTGRAPPTAVNQIPASPAVQMNNPTGIIDLAGTIPNSVGSYGPRRKAAFRSAEEGFKAFVSQLRSYDYVGYDSPRALVDNWMTEDPVPERIAMTGIIADLAGVDPKSPMNLKDPKLATKIAMALMMRETGGITYNPLYVRSMIERYLLGETANG